MKEKAEMLPEGYGISARYPGDGGIGDDPAVLFAEDFEGGELGAIEKRWDHVLNDDGRALELRRDAPPGSVGRYSLQITATRGVDEGGHLFTRFPGVDTAFLRFYVKYGEDCDGLSHGVILGAYDPPTPYPQGKAGLKPEGNDRAHTGIEPMGDPGHYPPPGIWHFYSYWQDMRTYPDGKYWGNRQNPGHPVPAVRGTWQCVEIMMKMNSAPQEYDGELALWIDGKLEAHFVKGAPRGPWTGRGFYLVNSGGEPFEGFRWRSTNDLKINFLWLEHYVAARAAPREGEEQPRPCRRRDTARRHNPTNRANFDDVVVSTQYIGPIKP